jgi:hypothetical protein
MRVSETEHDGPESKQELQRRMEKARESISETVAEIKSVVTHEYDEVKGTVETAKQSFGEMLDWRTEFERNPLVWGAGAVSIGILVGFGIAHAFDEEDKSGRRRKKSESKAGHIVAELSGFADVVLPTISSKVKELFGLDLDAYLRAAHEKKKTHAPSKKRRALQSKKSHALKPAASASAARRSAKRPAKTKVKSRAAKG